MSIRFWQKEMFIRGAPNFASFLRRMPVSEGSKRGLERFVGIRNLQGNVLDLGCGPGRFLEFFASRARSVVGVDISRPFLDQALQRIAVPKVRLVEEDMVRFLRKTDIQFNAIFRLYTSLGYFVRKEEQEILALAYRASANRGAMVIDSFNGGFFRQHGSLTRITPAGDVILHEEYYYEAGADRIACRWRFLPGTLCIPPGLASTELAWATFCERFPTPVLQEIPFKLDAYDQDGITQTARNAGWKVEGVYEDLTGLSAVSDRSERLVAVLHKS